MRIDLPSSPRILVVVLQRLGDVLLATPLIRSLRRSWPDAHIDALVFKDTAGILAGNPDLDDVVVMPSRPTTAQSLSLTRRLWRRYALSISTQAGDRPTFFAWAAGRKSIAPIERRLSGRLKKLFLHRSVPAEAHLHRVLQTLRLTEAIGIAPTMQVVCPSPVIRRDFPGGRYAVIHAAPMFRYKQWSADGWRALASSLRERGLDLVATGGPSERERAYLDDIWRGIDISRRDGVLNWRELTALIAGASVYLGPDTSVTHLAAATGCPTVALYGPTDPVLWGPWPAGGLDEPWGKTGALQKRGNVWLTQNALPCTPCQREGCERGLGSYSRCLEEMPLSAVLSAVDRALASGRC